MHWRNKIGVIISFSLIISLILAVMPLASCAEFPKPDLNDKDTTLLRDFSVYAVSIKVRNDDSGVVDWSDSVDAYVGDIVSFNIRIDNVCAYDLIDLQIVNIVDSPDVLSYITGSSYVNNINHEPLVNVDFDQALLTWDLNNFLANGFVNIIFDMVANSETGIDGVSSTVRVFSKPDEKYYQDLNFKRSLKTDKELELVEVIDDISNERVIYDGLVTDLNKLVLRETQLSSEISVLSDNINLKESEAVGIHSAIDLLKVDIDNLSNDQSLKEAELVDLQFLIPEKQKELDLKNDLIIQLESDLDLELVELNRLKAEYDAVVIDADVSSQTVKDLEQSIAVEEGLKDQLIKTITDTEAEIAVLNSELDLLLIQKTGLEEDIAVNFDQQNKLSILISDLENEYKKLVDYITLLEYNRDLKILEKENIQADISKNLALEKELMEDIESLKNVEKILLADIAAIDGDIVEQSDLLGSYQTQLKVVNDELDSISADLTVKNNDLLLNLKEIENHKLLKQDKIDYISARQLELDQYNNELTKLYKDLNDAYENLDINDDIVTGILSEIDRVKILYDQLNIVITDAEAELNAINDRIILLAADEALIRSEIATLDASLSDYILQSNELNVKINNLQSEIDELNKDILEDLTLEQQLSAQIFDKKNLLYIVEAELADLTDEEKSLINSIDIKTDESNTLKFERDLKYSDYQSTLSDIDLLEQTLDNKNNNLKILQDKLSKALAEKAEKIDFIDLHKDIIYGLKADLIVLNNELNRLYEDLGGCDVDLINIQRQIDDKLNQIAFQEQKIDAAVSDAEVLKTDVDQLIIQRDQLQAEIDNIDKQIKQNNDDISLLSSDLDDIVDSITAKELAIVSIDEKIITTSDDLQRSKDLLDAKALELGSLNSDILSEQKLLSDEQSRYLVLSDKKTSLEVELSSLKNSQYTGLETLSSLTYYSLFSSSSSSYGSSTPSTPSDPGIPSDPSVDQQIEALELEIQQVDREIKDCNYNIDKYTVDLNGLYAEKTQLEAEISSLSILVADKQLIVDGIIQERSILEGELNQLNTDKAAVETSIQNKLNENSNLVLLKNQKITELDNLIEVINTKQVLYQQNIDDIIVFNTVLAQYETELALLYDQRDIIIQNSQGANDDINRLISSINTKEDQITQTTIVKDNAVSELNLINVEIDGLNEDIRLLSAEIAVLNEDLNDDLAKIPSFEAEIADIDLLISDLNSDIEVYDSDLLRVKSLIAVKKDEASALRVDVASLEYQHSVVSTNVASFEDLKALKLAEKDLYVNEYNTILLVIDDLFDQKAVKKAELDIILSNIDSEELLKAEKIEFIDNQKVLYDKYQVELSGLYVDLDTAVSASQGSNDIIIDFQNKIDIKEKAIAEKTLEKTTAETELAKIIETLNGLYADKNILEKDIADINSLKTTKTLEKDSLTLSISSANNKISSLEDSKALKFLELLDTQNSLSVKESELLNVRNLLVNLNTQDTSLSSDISSLNNDISDKQLLLENVKADISKNQIDLDELKSYYNVLVDDKSSVDKQITTKQNMLDMKNKNLADYTGLLEAKKLKLISLNEELDQARINAAGDNQEIITLLALIDSQDLVVAQKTADIQVEKDSATLLEAEINNLLLSEQNLKDEIQLIGSQILDKQNLLNINNDNLAVLNSELDVLRLDKTNLENEYISVGLDKADKIDLIAEKEESIDSLKKSKYVLDDEISVLDDDIKKLEEDIIVIEKPYLSDTSAKVYVSINPDDTVHLIDIENYVWNTVENKWDKDTNITIFDNIDFKITVSNQDDMIFNNVIVENYLPVEILEYSSSDFFSPAPNFVNDSVIIWTIDELDVGGEYSFEFNATARYVGFDFDFTNVYFDSEFISYDKVKIGVNNLPNIPPVAVDDTYTTEMDTSIDMNVIHNDFDPDSTDLLSIDSIDVFPAHGEVFINSGNMVTYIPDPGFYGADSFVYNISDSQGGFDTGIVTIQVNLFDINQAPVATDDYAETYENASVIIDALSNDFDPDYPDGALIDPTTVEIITMPQNGSIIVDQITGLINYTPNPGFTGTDTFNYTVDDTQDLRSNTGIVTVDVKLVEEEEISFNILTKPTIGKIYILDSEPLEMGLFGEIFKIDSIVIGKINVELDLNIDEFTANRVEYYIDSENIGNSTSDPFNLTIDRLLFGTHTLKVVAYDGEESISQDCKIFFINFGFSSKI